MVPPSGEEPPGTFAAQSGRRHARKAIRSTDSDTEPETKQYWI